MTKQRLLLAINIGNTNISLGLFAGRALVRSRRVPIAQKTGRSNIFSRIGWARPDAIAIASVNPPVTRLTARAVKRWFAIPPIEIGGDVPVPLRVRCRFPERVGIDRLLNALAVRALGNCPAIIADFGSAITVDAVSSRGDFLGGAILPGVAMSARALYEGTAKLPPVKPRRPRATIGKQTEEAIRSGIYWGTRGAVKEIVERLRRRLGRTTPLIATGGDVDLFSDHLPPPCKIIPDLTLMGIARAFESWEKKAGRRG